MSVLLVPSAFLDEMAAASAGVSGGLGGARAAEQQHNRQVGALQRQIAGLAQTQAELDAQAEAERGAIAEQEAELHKMQVFAARLVKETQKLEEQEVKPALCRNVGVLFGQDRGL